MRIQNINQAKNYNLKKKKQINYQISLILVCCNRQFKIWIRTILKNMKKIRIMEWIMMALLIGTVAICQSVRQIAVETKDIVKGYTNQSLVLSIPFDKCYKMQSEMVDNQKIIDFKPTRVGFRAVKSYFIGDIGSNVSVLEQLRSPMSFSDRILLVFKDYQVIIVRPNLVLIVQQSREGFVIKNRYIIEKIQLLDRLDLFKIGQQGLLTVEGKNQIYLLGSDGYKIFSLPYPSKITHVQQTLERGQFFAIQFMKGLTLYRISKEKVKAIVVKSFDGSSVGLQNYFKYLTHFNTKYYNSQGLIFVLDSQIGLIQLNMTQAKPKAKIIISHKACSSFEIIKRYNFVLLCQDQNKGYSYIIRAYVYYDQRLAQLSYRKLQPILLGSYLTHIRATQFYYFIYSSSKIYIVENTVELKLPQNLQTKNQIIIRGLQSCFLNLQDQKNSYFYTIERGGFLHKYILFEQQAQLALISAIPIFKVIKLYIYGNCADLKINQSQNAKAQICKMPINILVKITEQEHPLQQFSINASIIVVVITVFLLMIWICLKKYKGLQRQARRVMQKYNKARISSLK